MSIESLSPEIKKEMEKEIKEKANTTGCRIKVDGENVKVIVPENNEDKILLFSKREVRELFERLYSE